MFLFAHDAVAYRMEGESEDGSERNSDITSFVNTSDFHQEGGCSKCVRHETFMT